MKKLLKIIPALVFAACCFMFAAKCLKAGGFTGAIADFPTAIHRAVKGQMQTTTDYLNGEQTEYDESVFTGEYHYYYEKLSDDDKLIYRQIYAMMQKRMDGISLNTTDTDNVSRIQQFVLLDNPQFFYIEKSQYTVRNSIIFSPVYNMSESDIDKAVKEAAEFEAQDKKRKEAIDARNDADSFVFQTQQALDQVGANLDANDKAEVEADLNAVKSFLDAHQNAEEMTDADVAELKAAQEKLTQSAQKVFAKMYEQTQAAQGAQGAGPDMGNMGGAQTNNAGAADDDVVDADFKEV